MDKQQLLDKTKETLAPFETAHVIDFIKTLSVKSAMEHPLFFVLLFLFFAFGIIRRSKFVLLFLFTAISLMLIVRYFAPVEGDQLEVSTTVPFAFCGLAVGAALIYFIFIKSD